MTDLKVENLRKGAEPVNNAAIIDMIQTNIFEDIGCGPLCRVNPLTDRGKRFQLIKILCLTVIPIMGVWGFTMYSLSDSVKSKSDIEVAKRSMTVVVMLGRLIHRLQRERDMSVLYLSDLGPGTKTFLLAEYIATDDALQRLSIWPGELKVSPREEFRSKANLMTYISQHRNSLNPATVDLYVEINFYSSITREFLEWLVENIKGSGFGSTWKTLVAYQKITRCKENIGVERAYGAMFYAYGGFPSWSDFEFYNEQIHDFKYNYKTAVFYSALVVPLHTEEVKEIKSSGLNITSIMNTYRYEIQYHDPQKNYTSNEKAKWFFDNMTEYLDSLLLIQEEVAHRISEEVDIVLAQVVFKVVVYAVLVVVVIGMCPIIMFSSEALASDIQKYTQTLVHKTTELNIEKHKADTLIFQMVPKSIAKKLRSQCSYVESDYFKSASILFADIFGFNQISMKLSPIELVTFLHTLYLALDERIDNYDVYKVETINDCYMVASGIPIRNGENHVAETATLALDLLHVMNHMTFPFNINRNVNIRIGIHTGACMAGIVGTMMLKYCLFGPTVYIASRMKSSGLPNKIHVSDQMFSSLMKCGKFKMRIRGTIEVSPTIKMTTYWVLDKNEFDSGNLDPTERSSIDENITGNQRMSSYFERKRNSVQSIASESSDDNKGLPPSLLKMPANEWKEEEIFEKC
ncbi:guanylate cyclase alpha-like [Ruditapes philippinarum]|uniref:guanylate cyclase alpha-like n=1 Tax=Ruditapes philippinarum TaxID=129788 RepID=UPI00295B6EA4|nr:guanylate cyclase alpha-like [Ruditapes philippinarum]